MKTSVLESGIWDKDKLSNPQLCEMQLFLHALDTRF